jgi:hypothetical protein
MRVGGKIKVGEREEGRRRWKMGSRKVGRR